MLERLVHKADFERLLASRSRLRSAHFALHHVQGCPAAPKKPARALLNRELSTAPVGNLPELVDNPLGTQWLGCVVPKRQARRAVTRSLIKRQMRSAFQRHCVALPAGLWLLRLSQGFPVAQFISARSEALTRVLREELDQLLLSAVQRGERVPRPAAAGLSAGSGPADGVLC
jgi:ribonuclease P protein component